MSLQHIQKPKPEIKKEKDNFSNSNFKKQEYNQSFISKSDSMDFNLLENKPVIQAKLKVSKPGDEYEREAERVAEEVVRMPSAEVSNVPIKNLDNRKLNHKCKNCEDENSTKNNVYRKTYYYNNNLGISNNPVQDINYVIGGKGSQLDLSTRTYMESQFGYDFRNVRIHTDEKADKFARSVNSVAFTRGNDVFFGAGNYNPTTLEGKRLIAHELTHTIQQRHGETIPRQIKTDSTNYTAPNQGLSNVGSGAGVIVNGRSEMSIARTPRSIEVSLDPTTLSFTELENEIKEIQQHLDENPVSNPENDHLMEVKGELQMELANRDKEERIGKKQQRKVKTAHVPLSLNQSLVVDENLSNEELYNEIDAIHEMLRTKMRKSDRVNLSTALKNLENEKQRREGVYTAQVRAEKIQSAFTSKVTGTDSEALTSVMEIIDNIRPSESQSGMYAIISNGKVIFITLEEYEKIRSTAKKNLQDGLRRVRDKADDAVNQYNAQAEINKEHPIVSRVVHFFGGIDDPRAIISQSVYRANLNAKAAEQQIQLLNLKRAAQFFAVSEINSKIAKRASQAYVEEIISTGESIITVLEVTRDAAFATTLAIGAIVAAPVVAAGAAGLGATGVTATAVTTVGTGLAVGTQGAILRGGSAALGVGLAGGSKEEVLAAAKEEGGRGFKEGVATGFGGGVAQKVGVALKVGQSTSTAVNIVRGSAAQGLGNAAGSSTSTALEGGSVKDVLKSSAKGFVIGGATGPLSHTVSTVKNPVLATIARTGLGGVASGGITYLETGNKEAALRSAAIGGASAGAIGLGKPPDLTPAQQKAFNIGQKLRSKIIGSKASTTASPTTASPTTSIPTTSQNRIESLGADPPGQRTIIDPFTGQPGRVTASAQAPRAIHGHIRGTGAEFESYNIALQRGEIGLQRPGRINEGGPDFITASIDPNGQIEIIVNDATINPTKIPKTNVGNWLTEVQDAISPARLRLNNPQLENDIRLAESQGRIRVRTLQVRIQPEGRVDITGW